MIGAAESAVEAALAAGASDAEAYASEAREREVRVHGGEIESLTAATQRGLGLRAWIGGRVGYAYGTDLGEPGLAALAARAVESARAADEDEFAGPPAPSAVPPPELELRDPSIESWSMAEVADLALAVEREARAADPRVAGVEQAVYAGSADRVAIASSTGIAGEYESSSCYAYAMVLAEGEDGTETGLGFDLARGPAALDPVAAGREGAERATAMIGAGKPESRGCPVVLDPTVAASFVGLVGGVLGADAVQRGRSPFAERVGTAVGSGALTVHDDGLDPAGPATAPFDGEGLSSTRTALIEARHAAHLPLRHLHGQARRRRVDRERRARRLPQPAARLGLEPRRRPRLARLRGAARRGGRGRPRHRRRRPPLGRQPGHGRLLGGRLGPCDPRRRAGRAAARVHDRQRPGLDARAVKAAGAESRWVPFGGSVSTPALLIGEMTVAGA